MLARSIKSIFHRKVHATFVSFLGGGQYWIVDYRGQIPAKYCLQDKGSKVVSLKLTNGIYQKAEYLQGEVVPCSMFLELKLTVDQILAAKE